MSLVTQLSDVITRIGTEFKAVRTERAAITGALASLATTDKSTLVAAINEVLSAVGSGGTIDADSITDATTIGKALIRAADATTARTAIAAGTSNLALGTTSTTAKAGDYAPNAAAISDSTTTGRALVTASNAAAARTAIDVYSVAEADAAAAAAAAAVVASAPSALNTLDELAAALGDDANYAATTATALGNRLRVDASQGLNGTQQTQGQDNLSVYSRAQLGDPTTDFVAVLEAALV
ncbi:hypothetical protein [Nocardia salmonicida]|uniref:hypothetical protein n=1 Tax=Nocardia salmonicida TaxID=53431 RepID=UPI002E27B0AB|nr:hypothetical protein [Nocardia salmonicida]